MVAFFCVEYALDDRLPFAGGLGVLAADYIMEAGKQGFPMVAVGLAYNAPLAVLGFTHQTNYWEKSFGTVKLLLLDSKFVTPYGQDMETQIDQELFLAFEGVKLLKSLGIKPDVYHLNEGHTAFVILADPDGKFVATKHTILSQSGLHISKDVFLRKVVNDENIFQLGSDEKHPDFFSSNKFLLRHASRSNGVSVMHVKVEKEVHTNSPLIPITNGINLDRWRVWDTTWQHHEQLRANLINLINSKTGSRLDPNILTVVWARRLVEYKQPEMILTDMERLSALINHQTQPMQFVVCGTAGSPSEPISLSILERLEAAAKNPALSGRFAFFSHYSLELSKTLVCGADVWLNTPKIGYEACGTSSMKAGVNGALLLSTPDGWVPEEDWSHGGGWMLGDLYETLGKQIAPIFYSRDEQGLPKSWLAHMGLIMNLIATKYTTARMLKDYQEKLYNLT